MGQMSTNLTRLGKPGLSGVDLICNKFRYMSSLVSKHFLGVHLMSLMHTATCPLLWWWYDDDTACSMFRFLQNFFNFLETKLPPASDIILLGNPYSSKMTLHTIIKLSANKLCLYDHWEVAVIIYYVRRMFIIQRKYVCSNYFPWFACINSFIGLCLLKIMT